jgi:hypothetical protein
MFLLPFLLVETWRILKSNMFAIVNHGFVPHGQIVRGQFYLEDIKHLREAEWRKRPEGWSNKTWMLHHDNAPAHTLLFVLNFWQSTRKLSSPNHPTLKIWQTFFFLQVEMHSEMSPISDDRRDRRKCAMKPACYHTNTFENLNKHWKQCIDNGGENFECDKS